MIRRDTLVDCADTIFRNETRLGRSDIRDLQDAHNVNLCDGNDEAWFDGGTGACDHITVIDSLEFFERYVD